MTVAADAPLTADHDGTTYRFCSRALPGRFVADPEAVLHPEPAPPADAAAEYTCPMHPEVRQQGPGSCPICGWPSSRSSSPRTRPQPRARRHDPRFRIGLALAVPVVLLEMGRHLVPAVESAVPGAVSAWGAAVLTTPVVWWAGWPFLVRGWASVRTRNLNMFTLVALGTVVSMAFSVVGHPLRPACCPRRSAPAWARSTPTSSRPPSSPSSSCWGRSSSCAPATARRGRSARCSTSPRDGPAARRPRRRADRPVDEVRVGDPCACAPARRSPSTRPSRRAAPTTTSRSSRASPALAKQQGDTVVGGSDPTAPVASSSSPTRSAPTPSSRGSSRWSRSPAVARPHPAPRRPGLRVVRPRGPARGARPPSSSGRIVGPDPRLAHALVVAVSVVVIAVPAPFGLATPMSVMVGVGRGARTGVLRPRRRGPERLERVDTSSSTRRGRHTRAVPG